MELITSSEDLPRWMDAKSRTGGAIAVRKGSYPTTTAAILAAPFLGAAVAAGAAIFAGHMTVVANAAGAASGGVQVVDRMIDIYARRECTQSCL